MLKKHQKQIINKSKTTVHEIKTTVHENSSIFQYPLRYI